MTDRSQTQKRNEYMPLSFAICILVQTVKRAFAIVGVMPL
jgi:hypothetical protein